MTETAVVRDIAEDGFAAAVIEASHTRGVVVDFWAPWCAPCHQLAPVLERVAARHVGEVDLVKVDIDQAPALAGRYQVQGIPAVKAFRDGVVAAELTGVQPEPAVAQLFAAVAPTPADRLVARAAQADDDEAEQLLRALLDDEPGHAPAVLALASLLAGRGETEEARALLERVPRDGDVARLQAELSLRSAARDAGALDRLRAESQAGDVDATLELGRALAAGGQHADALEVLLGAAAVPAARERARTAILEVFEVLGDDHELVRATRPRLAALVF